MFLPWTCVTRLQPRSYAQTPHAPSPTHTERCVCKRTGAPRPQSSTCSLRTQPPRKASLISAGLRSRCATAAVWWKSVVRSPSTRRMASSSGRDGSEPGWWYARASGASCAVPRAGTRAGAGDTYGMQGGCRPAGVTDRKAGARREAPGRHGALCLCRLQPRRVAPSTLLRFWLKRGRPGCQVYDHNVSLSLCLDTSRVMPPPPPGCAHCLFQLPTTSHQPTIQ